MITVCVQVVEMSPAFCGCFSTLTLFLSLILSLPPFIFLSDTHHPTTLSFPHHVTRGGGAFTVGSVITRQLRSRERAWWGSRECVCAQQKGLRQLKRVMQQQYGRLRRQPTAILLLVITECSLCPHFAACFFSTSC